MICEEVDIKIEACEQITVTAGACQDDPDPELGHDRDLPNSSQSQSSDACQSYNQISGSIDDESYQHWMLNVGGQIELTRTESDPKPQLKERKHRVIHKCRECGKRCQTPSALQIHARSHSGEKPYKCDDCESSFAGEGNLRRHIKEVHLERGVTTYKPRNFICVTCGKGFVRTTQLNSHLKTHLTLEQRAIPCLDKNCTRRFNTPAQLRLHLKTHTDEKPFVCDFEDCTLKYKSADGLKHHKLSHVGLKPYVCGVEDCGKAYFYLSVLRDHERSKHSLEVQRDDRGDQELTTNTEIEIQTQFESESECDNENERDNNDPLQYCL